MLLQVQKRKPDIKTLKVVKTDKGKLIISLKCAVCGSKKLIFIEEQEGSEFLKWNFFSRSYFEIKAQMNKVKNNFLKIHFRTNAFKAT